MVQDAEASVRMIRLREALHAAPSKDAFRAVYDLIAESGNGYPTPDLPSWRDAQERLDATDEAERALATWDDSVRAYPINSTVLIAGEKVMPWAKLVRRVLIYRFPANDMMTLARSPLMANLTQVEAVRSEGDVLEAFIGPTAIRRLVVIDIRRGYIAEDTWRRLVTAPQLATLERLRLSDLYVQPELLGAWLDGTPGRSLRELSLEEVSEPVLRESVLARPVILGHLTALAARECHLDDATAALLARASDLAKLETLDLRDNPRITGVGRTVILDAPQFRSTTVLFD